MTYAPAISSILSPEYLANLVINHFGFNENTTCQVLKIFANHSYLINANDKKYVLRVYFKDWRTEIEVDEELRLLDYLKENGISVSYPIKDTSNNYVQKIKAFEGERFAVLFSFAEGSSIRVPTEANCHDLGVTMARMHQLTINKTINRMKYDAESLVNWALNLAKGHFSEDSSEMQYFGRATSRINSEFQNADSSNLRYGIVHLDLHYENLKVKEDSKITMFDFDNCGNGWLFLDIAYSLMLIFKNESDKEKYKRKRNSFIKGYESISAISKEEIRLLPFGGLAIWLHYTGVHVQRFDDLSNPFLSEEFLKYWIHSVNQWMEFNEIEI
jgi:Ser/Thr protein kinase RdoA (MazF antagonist)